MLKASGIAGLIFVKCQTDLTAVIDARIASLYFASRALVTSGICIGRSGGRLPSDAQRRRCAPIPFPTSLRLRSTFPALRPQTVAQKIITSLTPLLSSRIVSIPNQRGI